MSETTETTENLEVLNFENTPVLPADYEGYMDADDELSAISKHIKDTTVHNADIETGRIKFLYSTLNPKREGGRYVISSLNKRSDIDKMVNDDYDYIITVYYDVWKDLDRSNKIIQLDKALCGIDMGTLEKPVLKKSTPDTREYNDNLRYYGAETVLDSSEMVDLACQRISEEKREKKREEREVKKLK
tara:strand:+ start:4031 stop:4594 length:564 start_codon:yes stop_codon:yes gene_type:complete